MTAPMSERAAAIQAAQENATAARRFEDQELHDAIVAARAAHRGETERIQQRHIEELVEIDAKYPPEVK